MTTLAQGLTQPVFGSQTAFRAVMRAMAQPGRIEQISLGLEPPRPLPQAAAAICLALADFETRLWLSPSLEAAHGVAGYLRFHTGAPAARDTTQAAFAIVDVRRDGLDLATFAQGAPEYPDRSTTVIVICDSVGDRSGDILSGPGLRTEGRFAFTPNPDNFSEQWRHNRDGFPLGVDLIVTAGDWLACLPRSTRLQRETA